MSKFLISNRRPLSIAAAVIAGLWILSTIIAQVPSGILAVAFAGLAAVAFRAHRKSFNFGSKPMSHTGLLARLRAPMAAYHAAKPVKATKATTPAKAAKTKAAKPSATTSTKPKAKPVKKAAKDTLRMPPPKNAPKLKKAPAAAVTDEPTVESLQADLFAVRQLLAQEREVVAAHTDAASADSFPAEWAN